MRIKHSKINFGNEQGKVILILLVVAVILFTPLIAKWSQSPSLFVSEETYYNVRMINQFHNNGVLNVDLLQQTDYSFNLFHYLIDKINIDVNILARILPILMGVISLLLAYFLLKELELGETDILFSMIILSLTPVFIYSFTTFSPENLAFPLLLLGAILYLRGNYLSVLFIAPVALIDLVGTIITFFMMIVYYFVNRKNLSLFFFNFSLTSFLLAIGIIFFGVMPGLELVPLKTGLSSLFVSFGAITGYSLIIIGLFFVGLFSWWDRHTSKTITVVGVIILFAFSVFFSDARLFVSLIIAIPAGRAISYLAHREWEMTLIKDATIILVICSVLFASILFLNSQINGVDKNNVDAMKFLGTSDVGDVILSAERNGFLIEHISNRKVFLDENSFKHPDYNNKILVVNSIFYSRDLNELENLLVKNKITHILIDENMKTGEIWNGREEGLLFFLQNSNKFINIFDNKDIQIYRYLKDN